MALSPTRGFIAVSPSAGDVYREETDTVLNRGLKQARGAPLGCVRVIEVTGCAELSCPPDRASVTISVHSSKESVNDATNSVTRRLEYILQTARQHDVKDGNLTSSKYLRRDGDLFHMHAEVVVVFLDFEKMQQARSVLIEKLDKSVCVGDPYYSHSGESLSLLRRRVCLEAVDNARLKASEACCILGQALGRPLLVREEESREWTSGQKEALGSRLSIQWKTSAVLFFASSRMFVTFELRPKDSNRRKF
ncbi:hypothetical protein DNTS_009130 [Danionella cerebrum]|uniref:Interleukin-1 receptor-associated kinase 1-binding protein 1 n=1 Tax=Danionella cerebrum TaxID=2873325 RepID=A0A553QAS7_9TELE|nr:hypothetical protein DNTS_009130 [Danionella translucida]